VSSVPQLGAGRWGEGGGGGEKDDGPLIGKTWAAVVVGGSMWVS
jgi:hypothetical protein